MKQIPAILLNTFKQSGKATCFLVKVVDDDNEVHGFCTLDRIVRFDDGFGLVVYDPDQELRPMNIQASADMQVDNTELEGWFSEYVEQKVLAGMFNSAEITIYRVSYLLTEYGAEVIGYGHIGEIEYATNKQGKRKLEYRSLTAQLKSTVNPVFSTTCRNDFGDDRCKKPFVWEAGTIGPVEDQFLRFQLLGVAQPDGWFDLGVIEYLDGPNAGKTLEVESWTADGWLTLSHVPPYAMNTDDTLRIRQDCPKTEQACLDYNNIFNMAAEHLTPVADQSLMVPGAYIKSQNAL